LEEARKAIAKFIIEHCENHNYYFECSFEYSLGGKDSVNANPDAKVPTSRLYYTSLLQAV